MASQETLMIANRVTRPSATGSVVWGVPAAAPGGASTSRAQARWEESGSRWPARTAGLFLALLCWSATYLVRQPPAGAGWPISPVGDFLVEGMLLAVSWLALLVAACVAILTGMVEVRFTGDEQ